MSRRFDSDPEGAATRSSIRALVATLCVLGLVGLTFFHFGDGGAFASRSVAPTVPQVDSRVVGPNFLHAPTSDPSLPSLEATFSRKDVTPAEDAPAPTF